MGPRLCGPHWRCAPEPAVRTQCRPQGRPWQYQNTWVEIVDGRIAGQYVVVTQGANIYGFDYKNVRNGKAFRFAQDVAAYTDADGRCTWP